MFLLALLLGLASAWLAETGWNWCLDRLTTEEARARWRANRGRWVYALAVVATLSVATIFIGGVYGHLTGTVSFLVIAFEYLIAPSVLGSIVVFAVGIAVVLLRGKITSVLRELFAASRARPQTAAFAQRPSAGEGGGRQDGGATASYPWLTGIVGIAAVTLVAIITLVIFFPEVLARVQSIKVAGVEAQFAASASHIVHITSEAERTHSESNTSLNGWKSIDANYATVVNPVRVKLLEYAKASDDEIKKSNENAKWAINFLRAFAVPLSKVMTCYSKDFALVRNTHVQARFAAVAHDWAHFALQVLREAKGKPTDDQRVAQKKKFDLLKNDLYELVAFIDDDLFTRQSSCGLSSADKPYGNDIGTRLNKEYFASPTYLALLTEMDSNLPKAFSNGYVISFIADMILFTQTSNQALEFMNVASEYLDKSNDAITGRFNFYYRRVDISYESESWNVDTWRDDVEKARSIAETIADMVAGSEKSENTQSAKRLEHYFRALVATEINNSIYGYVREWLEGRRIPPSGLVESEDKAQKLQKWLQAQSYVALLNGSELNPIFQASLIAAGYDTLALYELMIGASKSDITKDRCGRISTYLNTSKRVSDALQDRSQLNLFKSHENLYVSACQP